MDFTIRESEVRPYFVRTSAEVRQNKVRPQRFRRLNINRKAALRKIIAERLTN